MKDSKVFSHKAAECKCEMLHENHRNKPEI